MSINNKIKKIINAIKDTEINDIEISSFWGFQKIKLGKGLLADIFLDYYLVLYVCIFLILKNIYLY